MNWILSIKSWHGHKLQPSVHHVKRCAKFHCILIFYLLLFAYTIIFSQLLSIYFLSQFS